MKTTPLHAAHKSLSAKMGEFAGYDMPLYYADGVMKEHEWVRAQAGLFDVSHMGQVILRGADVVTFLERITPSSFGTLPAGRAKYTVMTNEKGGIVDDLIVTRLEDDEFFAVINAGCKDKDLAWMRSHVSAGVSLQTLDDRALLALQGPEAERVLREVFRIDTAAMPYMWLDEARLPDGTTVYVSRVGYTGEDGFELSVPSDKAVAVWEALTAHQAVRPIGLAARDSLRLDMGYCLYGHDIDDTTTPLEAGLRWVMGKDNRGFIGAEVITDPPARHRVGVRLLDKGVAREGAALLGEEGAPIGKLTSGGYSPSLKESIGQGYVASGFDVPGLSIKVDVRGRHIPAQIVPLPFIPAHTKSMKKQAA